MGAGISTKRLGRLKYGRLKTLQRKLARIGVNAEYRDLELRGPRFRIYYAGCGPACNGERISWLVLRYNPEVEPEAGCKSAGDVDYTDFHTRTIPEISRGGFDAGLAILRKDAADGVHRCVWGEIERSHITGNPHRKCQVQGCRRISLDLDEE